MAKAPDFLKKFSDVLGEDDDNDNEEKVPSESELKRQLTREKNLRERLEEDLAIETKKRIDLENELIHIRKRMDNEKAKSDEIINQLKGNQSSSGEPEIDWKTFHDLTNQMCTLSGGNITRRCTKLAHQAHDFLSAEIRKEADGMAIPNYVPLNVALILARDLYVQGSKEGDFDPSIFSGLPKNDFLREVYIALAKSAKLKKGHF